MDYICDFHREQAWNRWVVSNENGLAKDEQNTLKRLLRGVANALTQTDFNSAVEALQSSTVYQKGNVQKYIKSTWWPEIKRWAKVFALLLLFVSSQSK